MVELEWDAEFNSALVIDPRADQAEKDSAAVEEAVQLGRANTSAVPSATGVDTPMEVQGEEEAETGEMAMLNVLTPESEMAMEAVSSPTPTHISIYLTVVSSPKPPSAPTPTGSTSTNCNVIFTYTAIILYPVGQGPNIGLYHNQL